ncbi:putative transporter svop-1, partial [Trichoplax sp. H2]
SVRTMQIAMLSLLGPLLICEWGISNIQAGLIVGLAYVGDIIGFPYLGWFCDHYGRKLGVIVAILCTSYFSSLSSLSSDITMMLLLRLVCGVSESGMLQCITILSELVPATARARSIVSLRGFTFIGIAFEGIIAYICLKIFDWRMVVYTVSALYLLAIPFSTLLVESPRYLLLHGFRKEAKDIIINIAKMNRKPAPEGNLITIVEGGAFTDLFKPVYRKRTIILWIITLAVKTIFFGAVWMAPLLVKVDRCETARQGATRMRCQCKEIDLQNILSMVIGGLGEPIAFIFVDWIGRRKSLILGLFISGVSSLLLTICANRIVRYALVLLMRSSSCFLVDVFLIYILLKAIGLGAATSFGGLGNILSIFLGQVLFATSDIAALVALAIMAALAIIFCLMIPAETKGTLLKFARTMQIAMLSLLGPLLVCEWGISTTEEALITGAFTFLGIAVEGILVYVLLKAFNWRILLFVTTALYLIPILLSSFIVESPRYLLLQEFKGEVSKIIEDAARLNNRPTPNGNLVANFEQSDGKFKDLFKPAYIRTTINLWLITFCMITIYFGAVWVTPLLAKVDSCNSKQGATGIRCHCKEMGPANIIAIIISGLGEPFGVIIICKNWSLKFDSRLVDE